jgi:hypothetical protein
MQKSLLLTSLLFAGSVFAISENPAESSVYACAKSIQAKTGANTFEVVRMTQRAGKSGNFRIWLNDADENIGGYCETF